MKINNENSGNIASSKEVLNNNISKLRYLGQAKRFAWSAKRSFRSI